MSKSHKVNIGSTARKNNVGDQHRSQHVVGKDYSHSVVVFYTSIVIHSVRPQAKAFGSVLQSGVSSTSYISSNPIEKMEWNECTQ